MTNTRAPIAFGTDGWRGRIARDLTFESLARVVAAAGRWARDARNTEDGDPDTIVFVHDTRFLSPELALHGAELLASQGFEVLLSDRPVPTPCASWHVATRGLRMGLAVTASHNPAEWNGVKVKSRFGGSAMPATYDAIARSADDPLPSRAGGAVLRTDLCTAYREALASQVDLEAIRRAGLRVIFDAMHGASGSLLEEIVGEGHETRVVTHRGERNPGFGGVNPEPIPQNLASSRARLADGFDLVVASAVLFFTSDLSSFVSGRTRVVDGAVDAKFPYGTL